MEFEENKIRDLLLMVDLEPRILDRYPYMLSGGQLQRVLIAISLLFDPEYIIADEPTASLDVITQRSIGRIFKKLVKSKGLAVLLITHDLTFAKVVANYGIVLHKGKVIEYGEIQELIKMPKSNITKNLVEGSMAVE